MQKSIKHIFYQFSIGILFLSMTLSYVTTYSVLAKHHFEITQASEDSGASTVIDFFDDEKIISQSSICAVISICAIITQYICVSSFDQYTFFHWQPPQLSI